jgi:membrane associated rhomboid family serine protease
MLEDRDYMRQPEFGQHRWLPHFRLRWTWTIVLIALYVIARLAQDVTEHFFPEQGWFFANLALSKDGLAHGYVWQLLTYQFMHAGWMHLFLNSWAIFFFGNELEMLLGGRRYLTLMFSSGIVGGVFQVLVAMLWPQFFDGPVVGASACAFGLIAAFAMLFPEFELTMLLFFVVPLRMRAKTLLIGSFVIALMGIIFPWDNIASSAHHVANAAHLGGMAMGWFYVKKIIKNPALLGIEGDNQDFRPQPAKPVEKAASEFQEGDVDAVLDKISARGINSLTARERAILEAARKKMAQR